jgi:hypothetical protein
LATVNIPRLKRLTWPATLAAFFLVGAAGGVIAARHRVAVVAKQNSVLDTPIDDVDLDNPTLDELGSVIAAKAHVPLRVNWPGLATIGLAPEIRLPCVVHITHTTIWHLLAICLKTAYPRRANVFTDGGAAYIDVDPGTEPQVVQTYELADMAPKAMNGVASVVMWNIAPDSWSEFGGPGGKLGVAGHTLFVLNTPDQQRDVEELLRQLHCIGDIEPLPVQRFSRLSFEQDPLDRPLMPGGSAGGPNAFTSGRDTTRFYPFISSRDHDALLARIRQITAPLVWPDWIVITGSRQTRAAVADLLKSEHNN